MYLYCGKVRALIDLSEEEISNIVLEGVRKNELNEREFHTNEIKSWGKSTKKFCEQLECAGLLDLSMILEYYVPGNLLRLDAVLVGYTHTSKLHVMVIEFKEWGTIVASPDAHHVNIGVSDQPIRQHPAAQLNHYITSLKCYHSELQKPGKIQLSSMSFLPNFTMKKELFEEPHLIYKEHYEKSCFVKGEESELVQFLRQSFVNQMVLEKDLSLLIDGEYSMSEASLAGISKALNGERFVSLLDEQRDVKVQAMALIDEAFTTNQQKIIVIKGEAGTGKTIMGLDLIRQYIKRYPASFFGTIPMTLRTVIDGFNKEYAEENQLNLPAKLPTVQAIINHREAGDLVVIDEAHRVTDLENVITKLRNRFKAIVLLQDDQQTIKITEKGTIANISKVIGHQPDLLNLVTQQRAKFSGSFIQNINRFINNEQNIEVDLSEYDLRTDLLLNEIDQLLKSKANEGHSVKWLASFCWEWAKKSNDIQIIDQDQSVFVKAWNPTIDEQYEWFCGNSSSHIEQVGCIYTAQGLEFDYVGLIFWDDLKFNKTLNKWQISLKENYDHTFISEIISAFGGVYIRQSKQVMVNHIKYELDDFIEKANATNRVTELVCNIYRVLLTRGKKGLYIWFKDADTRQHFNTYFNIERGEVTYVQ